MKTIYKILICAPLLFAGCEKETLTNETDADFQFDMKKNGKGQTKIDVCHKNGQLLNLPLPAVVPHLDQGGYLFSCNPSEAVSIDELEPFLTEIILEDGGDPTKMKDRKDAFETWYNDYYLTGIWEEENESPGSGGGTAGGGTGGGSLGGGSL